MTPCSAVSSRQWCPGPHPRICVPIFRSPSVRPSHGIGQTIGVIDQLSGPNALGAQGSMVYGTVRIAGDLCDLAVFDVDQNTAAAVTHTAMAFHNRVIAVNFHFSFCVGVCKCSHKFFLRPFQKRPLLPNSGACPVKCLPNEMQRIFHRGG